MSLMLADFLILMYCDRAIKFLVGLKGKSETMAVGGPWSPSLDGKVAIFSLFFTTL